MSRLAQTSATHRVAAATLLSCWLVARASEPQDAMSMRQAEAWFTASSHASLGALVDAGVLREAEEELGDLPYGSALDDVLPYLLEVFEAHANEWDVPGRISRRSKRKAGVVYTPSDVARYLSDQLIFEFRNEQLPACLDPACGTGIFMRSALASLSQLPDLSIFSLCMRYIHGIDISSQSGRSASFTLLSSCLRNDTTDLTPVEAWKSIHRNIVVHDSTVISPDAMTEAVSLGQLCPARNGNFQVVLGNPPYSSLATDGQSALRARLSRSAPDTAGKAGAVYPMCVEMMWRFSDQKRSEAGMVLPLSIAYNRRGQCRALRREMRDIGASLRVHVFDRSPDSLVGDDVKTRNAIVFVSRQPGHTPSVRTSGY